MPDVTVHVPDDRVPEFYQVFGLWLAGSLTLAGQGFGGPRSLLEASKALQPWGTTDADAADAATLWAKFSPRARAMFSLLIDNAGKEFTGEKIAAAVNIPNGAHGVAGVLAWPGRHGAKIGRQLPCEWREHPETFEGLYSMSEERAALFKAAREAVEAGGNE